MKCKEQNDFFVKNQKLILEIANTKEGRNLLGVEKKSIIVKVTPNSIHVLKDFVKDKPIIQAFFYTQNKMAEVLLPIITKILIAYEYNPLLNKAEAFLHYSDIERKGNIYPQIFLSTSTFNNAITDMSILSSGSSNWTTIRNGNNLSVSAVWPDTVDVGVGATFDGANRVLARTFFHFNTASLPDGSTLLSAFLRVVGTATDNDNANSDTAHIVASSGASDTTIATSDWGNVGSTSFGSISFASWNTSGNNDFTLDANGIANISKTAYSKFAMRDALDINNSSPSGRNNKTYSTSTSNQVLSVTYSLPSGGNPMFFSTGGLTLG